MDRLVTSKTYGTKQYWYACSHTLNKLWFKFGIGVDVNKRVKCHNKRRKSSDGRWELINEMVFKIDDDIHPGHLEEFIEEYIKSNGGVVCNEFSSNISDKTWSISTGLGTNRNFYLLGISKDFKINNNFSYFLATGIGYSIIGTCLSFQNNYNNYTPPIYIYQHKLGIELNQLTEERNNTLNRFNEYVTNTILCIFNGDTQKYIKDNKLLRNIIIS